MFLTPSRSSLQPGTISHLSIYTWLHESHSSLSFFPPHEPGSLLRAAPGAASFTGRAVSRNQRAAAWIGVQSPRSFMGSHPVADKSNDGDPNRRSRSPPFFFKNFFFSFTWQKRGAVANFSLACACACNSVSIGGPSLVLLS